MKRFTFKVTDAKFTYRHIPMLIEIIFVLLFFGGKCDIQFIEKVGEVEL